MLMRLRYVMLASVSCLAALSSGALAQSPGNDLTPETAARLKVAWTYRTNATPPSKQAAQIAAFEATPLLADGFLYLITPFDQVIALDPATGREQWRYDPHIAGDRAYSEASARGVAVTAGRLSFGTLESRLIALNAKSGKVVWQTRLGPQANDGHYQITSPPVVTGTTV